MFSKKLLLLSLLTTLINANTADICQIFQDGIQTRANNSEIDFKDSNSYLYNNPDNLLNTTKIKNQITDWYPIKKYTNSCQDINNTTTDKSCLPSKILGIEYPNIQFQTPAKFKLNLPVTNSKKTIKYSKWGGVETDTPLDKNSYKKIISDWYPNLNMPFIITDNLKINTLSTTSATSTLSFNSSSSDNYNITIKELTLKNNTTTTVDDLIDNIEIKKVKTEINNDLTLKADSSINIEELKIGVENKVLLKAPSITINTLQDNSSNTPNQIEIYANYINIQSLKLGYNTILKISPYDIDKKITLKIKELKTGSANKITFKRGTYYIKKIKTDGSNGEVDWQIEGKVDLIIKDSFTLSSKNRINADKNSNICNDSHYAKDLFIYCFKDIKLKNQSKIVGVIYSQKNITLESSSSIKGAVSADKKVTLKYDTKVCYETLDECGDTTPTVESLTLLVSNTNLTVDDNITFDVIGEYSDNTHKDLTNKVDLVVSNPNLLSIDNNTITAINDGNSTIKATYNNVESNQVNIEIKPKIELTSVYIKQPRIDLRINKTTIINVIGKYSDSSSKEITDECNFIVADQSIITVNANSIEPLTIGETTIKAECDSLESSSVVVIVAKELDTSNIDFTNFGNRYIDDIPADATIEKYDEDRFCMIAGDIIDEDNQPLSNVKITLHKNQNYGSTLTNRDGHYTIPAEGGVTLIVVYQKEGYTTLHRKIIAPIKDWVKTADVTMLKLDEKVTDINLTDPTPQIHQSTVVTDDREPLKPLGSDPKKRINLKTYQNNTKHCSKTQTHLPTKKLGLSDETFPQPKKKLRKPKES